MVFFSISSSLSSSSSSSSSLEREKRDEPKVEMQRYSLMYSYTLLVVKGKNTASSPLYVHTGRRVIMPERGWEGCGGPKQRAFISWVAFTLSSLLPTRGGTGIGAHYFSLCVCRSISFVYLRGDSRQGEATSPSGGPQRRERRRRRRRSSSSSAVLAELSAQDLLPTYVEAAEIV